MEYSPGKLFVNRYVRPKYVKPTGQGNKIIIAAMPDRVLPKCMAGPASLAALVIAKFMDHIPLYRQSQKCSGGRVLTPGFHRRIFG
ncbi:MAG: hypothetical protein IPG01_14455 [Chitinophagaceae bacterium]|nr:hypothetical protein [Chitinophagaceae bacterium]